MRCGCAPRRGRGASRDLAGAAPRGPRRERHDARERAPAETNEPTPRAQATMGNVVVVPPNKAAVISGVGGTKFLIGECGWAWWCCNNVDYLDLEFMQLNVSSRQVETGEGVKLNVDAVTQVKVACFPPAAEGMERTLDKGNLKLACQHFLGEKTKAVQESLTATMEGPPAPGARHADRGEDLQGPRSLCEHGQGGRAR